MKQIQLSPNSILFELLGSDTYFRYIIVQADYKKEWKIFTETGNANMSLRVSLENGTKLLVLEN